jgi:hypothetical protein
MRVVHGPAPGTSLIQQRSSSRSQLLAHEIFPK